MSWVIIVIFTLINYFWIKGDCVKNIGELFTFGKDLNISVTKDKILLIFLNGIELAIIGLIETLTAS